MMPTPPPEEHRNTILQCLLRGFYSNTARLMPDGSYKTMTGNQTVAIHPSSVLFGRKVEAIAFTEFVYTTKSYARGCSAVRLTWIGTVLEGFGI
jgi:ATP-dependent RNA helicase DHR2